MCVCLSGECVTRQCRCLRSKKMWNLLELELVDAVSSLLLAAARAVAAEPSLQPLRSDLVIVIFSPGKCSGPVLYQLAQIHQGQSCAGSHPDGLSSEVMSSVQLPALCPLWSQ